MYGHFENSLSYNKQFLLEFTIFYFAKHEQLFMDLMQYWLRHFIYKFCFYFYLSFLFLYKLSAIFNVPCTWPTCNLGEICRGWIFRLETVNLWQTFVISKHKYKIILNNYTISKCHLFFISFITNFCILLFLHFSSHVLQCLLTFLPNFHHTLNLFSISWRVPILPRIRNNIRAINEIIFSRNQIKSNFNFQTR